MTVIEPRIRAQLQLKRDISDGLAVFRFALEQEFVFKAGQYATIWLTHQGKMIPRPYSIASAPSESRSLEFYINLVEHGRLTPSLWDPEVLDGLQNRKPGTRVEITGPKGRFILDARDHRDLVFVASGTGLAPFMSMIRELNAEYLSSPETGRRRNLLVIHGASFSRNLGYDEELRAMARESANDPRRWLAVAYLPTISRPHLDPSWNGLCGRAESFFDCTDDAGSKMDTPTCALKNMLRVLVRHETHAVYVCGHPGTVDSIERILTLRGFRQGVDVKREKYYR